MNKISFQRIQLASSECCAERTTLGVALRMAYHSICFMPCLRRPITNNLDKNKRHYAMLPRLLRVLTAPGHMLPASPIRPLEF